MSCSARSTAEGTRRLSKRAFHRCLRAYHSIARTRCDADGRRPLEYTLFVRSYPWCKVRLLPRRCRASASANGNTNTASFSDVLIGYAPGRRCVSHSPEVTSCARRVSALRPLDLGRCGNLAQLPRCVARTLARRNRSKFAPGRLRTAGRTCRSCHWSRAVSSNVTEPAKPTGLRSLCASYA